MLVKPPEAKYLIKFFLLSQAEWKKIYRFQKGKCGVCGKPLKGKVSTDHRHSDGLVRGICHWQCNNALREWMTVKLLKRMLKYLRHPPATEALGREHFALPGRIGTKKMRKLAAKLRKDKKEGGK